MKTILCLALLVCAVSPYLASIMFGRFYDPANPTKCTISKDYVVDVGRSKDTRVKCGLVICSENHVARFFSCIKRKMLLPRFKYGDYVNASRPYPECCELRVLDASPKRYTDQMDGHGQQHGSTEEDSHSH